MKAPIVSRKHYTQNTEFSIASAAVTVQSIVTGVAVQDVNSASEVTEGSMVKAIYIERWLQGKHASAASSYVLLVEKSDDSGVPSFTNMTTLDAYFNKKNVLFVSQAILAPSIGNPTPVLRQWVKIPKGKQRIGLGDNIRVAIAAIGSNDLLGCGFSVYKSYS